MKTAPENRKKLSAIKKALRRGIPLSEADVGEGADRESEGEAPPAPEDDGTGFFPLAGRMTLPPPKEKPEPSPASGEKPKK